MATTQHRPHGAFAGPLFGTLDGKTEDTTPAVEVKTQHRPHGAFAGPRFGALSGKGSSSAATISAVYGTPLSGTTATVGCTTDTASGTLAIVVTTSATKPSIAQIKAGQDHTGAAAAWSTSALAVSSTSPSTTATGLTAATTYYTHAVQTVSAVDSNVVSSSSWVTDTVGGGGGSLAVDVGLATETDTAYGLALTKILSAGLATETDSALALALTAPGAVVVGTASETDTALGLSLTKIASAGMASESDAALALGVVRKLAAGVAAETDAAQSLALRKFITTGLATETDEALPVTLGSFSLGIAQETDTAFALVLTKVVTSQHGGGGSGRPSWARPRKGDRRAEDEEEALQLMQRLQEDVLLLGMVRDLYEARAFEPLAEEA